MPTVTLKLGKVNTEFVKYIVKALRNKALKAELRNAVAQNTVVS